jgi:hypothetical protein
MADIYPVNFERHGKKRFVASDSWAFTEKQGLAPLLCSEFPKAAHCLPIVFAVQNKETRQLGAFALLGLQPDMNLLVDVQGNWLGRYIPAIFRRYPFLVVKGAADKEEYIFCIDEAGGHLFDSGGQPLFDAKGNQSAFLKKVFNFVRQCQQQVPVGEKLCALLQKFDLFTELILDLPEGQRGKMLKMSGLLRVDEKKLGALSDADFLELRRFGALALIYAHLFSLRQVEALAERLKNATGKSAPGEALLPESFSF